VAGGIDRDEVDLCGLRKVSRDKTYTDHRVVRILGEVAREGGRIGDVPPDGCVVAEPVG